MSDRVAELLVTWGLDLDPMTREYGDWNRVLFVHRGATPYVLKLTGEDHSAAHEAAALAAWNGNGAVCLIDSAPDALLLERLDPDRSLNELTFRAALPIYLDVVRRLCIPAPGGLPTLNSTVASVAQLPDLAPEVLPANQLNLARRLAAQLAADQGDSFLVHGDLHCGNILAGHRQPWLAIDPKPAAGHPERVLAELMWTRIHEIDDVATTVTSVANRAGFNPDRARAWVIVRATSYLVWAVRAGLTEDPAKCRRLIQALA